MHAQTILSALLFGTVAVAAPSSNPGALFKRQGKTAAAIIAEIMPGSTSCQAKVADCRTAEQAAPHYINAFQRYDIWNTAEMAAVLALVGLESGELQYSHNVFPGRPGQGTNAMLMPNFVFEYARSIPELKGELDAITTATSPDGQSADVLNAVLALVQRDEFNFGAGPWYYHAHGSQATKAAFAGGDIEAGWKSYMADVGVDGANAERVAFWTKAKAAFGL